MIRIAINHMTIYEIKTNKGPELLYLIQYGIDCINYLLKLDSFYDSHTHFLRSKLRYICSYLFL